MRIRRHFLFIATSLVLLGIGIGTLTACSSAERVLQGQEEFLEIDGPTEHQFHSLLYFPKGTALHYPGYVLGFEKAPQDTIGGPKISKPPFLRAPVPYFQAETALRSGLGSTALLDKLQSDAKAFFVSHIVKFQARTRPVPASEPYTYTDHCFIYNALALVPPDAAVGDPSQILAWRDCPSSFRPGSTPTAAQALYGNGEQALASLQENLAEDLRTNRFTHIIVVVMGWNSAQDEAVRNFNDIIGNLLEAAYEESAASRDLRAPKEPAELNRMISEFRPLVVGVTWPSFWSTARWNFFSYANKANDADELGISWLNLFLNQSIPAALRASDSRARLIVIGHSFGARAATRALFSSPALASHDDDMPTSSADLIVGLQGAVSINRFHAEAGDEGAPYRDFARLENTRIVLTASRHDTAAGGPVFWYDPFGSIQSYQEACDSKSWHARVFECLRAEQRSTESDGQLILWRHEGDTVWEPAADARRRVLYVDASDGVVQYNSPSSGGGAHSDIYRLPTGRLLWTLIRSLAPYSSRPNDVDP